MSKNQFHPVLPRVSEGPSVDGEAGPVRASGRAIGWRFHLWGLSFGCALAVSGGALWAQVPDGPPDISPTPFNAFTPVPLGVRIIPPFNIADPGSTDLAIGQRVELRVILSSLDGAAVQWIKDGQSVSGETEESLKRDDLSSPDAGEYRVDITRNGTIERSLEVDFRVVPMAQLDDPFERWTRRFFSYEALGDPEQSGALSDPDLDGLGNLVEFFFGLSPIRTGAMPDVRVTASGADRLSFAYARARERSDLVLSVEGSSSMDEWVALSVLGTTVTEVDATMENVELEVAWPIEPAFPRFVRLIIEKQEP